MMPILNIIMIKKNKKSEISSNNMNKSSSTNKIELNTNQFNQLNFKVGEIREKDIFENRKEKQKENNIIKFKKTNCCFKCGISDYDKSFIIPFTCNHIYCFNCIIKNLMIIKFKNIENKNKIQFSCGCLIGNSREYEFNEILQKIRGINNKNYEKPNCKQHKNEAIKFCKDCEKWLCEECIKIHSMFNGNHSLSNKQIPLKNKCKIHIKNYTEYFCLYCKEEICPLCIANNSEHSKHKTLKFGNFSNLTEEIIAKLKYKTYDECMVNLERIKQKNNSEKNKKIEIFEEKIDNLIKKIKNIQEKYIKEVNDKMEN